MTVLPNASLFLFVLYLKTRGDSIMSSSILETSRETEFVMSRSKFGRNSLGSVPPIVIVKIFSSYKRLVLSATRSEGNEKMTRRYNFST